MLRQPYAMANFIWYLLAPMLLLLLLWYIHRWQGRRRGCSIRAVSYTGGNSAEKTSDPRSSFRTEGGRNLGRQGATSGRQPYPWQERRRLTASNLGLSERKGWLDTFPPPPSTMHVRGPFPSGMVQSGITSGKLAEMAYRQNDQDLERRTIRQGRDGGRTTRSLTPLPRCSDRDDVTTREAEASLVKYYLDADLRSVWKRRAMAFLGQ